MLTGGLVALLCRVARRGAMRQDAPGLFAGWGRMRALEAEFVEWYFRMLRY